MFCTYVLLCSNKFEGKKDFYIGYTGDLNNRLKEHINGKVATTKKFNSINLVYYEACLGKTDAIKRELQLKTGFGRGYLKKRLSDSLK